MSRTHGKDTTLFVRGRARHPGVMRTRGRAWAATLSLAALLPLTGCYTYATTSLDSLAPGLQARVRLDEDGFGRVLNQAVTNGVPAESMDVQGRGVVGRVVQLGAEDLTVELRGVGGSVFSAAVPNAAIREVALRRFSPRRTISAVAVGAALFAAVYTGTTGGTTTDEPPPDPDLMVLRLFSISVP